MADVVPNVCQSALDLVVPPRRILTREAKDKVDDLLQHRRSANGSLPLTVVPFLRDQLAVPSQDRVWRDNGRPLSEQLPAQILPLDCQHSPLVISQSEALLPQLLPQDGILGQQVLQELPLFLVQPTGERHHEEVEGGQICFH
mgnify:CR=1 FL=1